MRQYDRDVPADALLGGRATLDGLYKAGDEDLLLDVRLESVVEGVLATGRVSGTVVGQCARCLDSIEVEVDADFQELFYYSLEDLTAEEAEEAMLVVEEQVSVESPAHDAVMLELPLQPLCEDDCLGLCAECGARLADDPEHHHESVDPRWAALSGLVAKGGDPDADPAGSADGQ